MVNYLCGFPEDLVPQLCIVFYVCIYNQCILQLLVSGIQLLFSTSAQSSNLTR
ncbi:hypothetical protein BDV36DRAFT_86930 [Aspergillus pseudocaelatus]|uniref:Uncharacterized protein n=1 Tax=Aspergillus pseudocaelatus TaxID=1825620 RepID=A0ABQ6WUX4_9EURO|nr:hypothetical protein BDV36DRAFT_86930 [Aspergillus pseudocaelatus]